MMKGRLGLFSLKYLFTKKVPPWFALWQIIREPNWPGLWNVLGSTRRVRFYVCTREKCKNPCNIYMDRCIKRLYAGVYSPLSLIEVIHIGFYVVFRRGKGKGQEHVEMSFMRL